ncbi:MAG: hypothetical protein PF501_09590 [Salinisphaera sp.]|jgi:hypothetical protein|nr:hypothetical protein [Salinisphaera sp.]
MSAPLAGLVDVLRPLAGRIALIAPAGGVKDNRLSTLQPAAG